MKENYHFQRKGSNRILRRGAITPSLVLSVFLLCQFARADSERSFSVVNTHKSNWFAEQREPSKGKSFAVGSYSAGCLFGGKSVTENQRIRVMRKERNRFYGHPSLLALLERASKEAPTNLPLLVGDVSQPRGGPMPFGHASHQIGLDVDLWFPDQSLSNGKEQKEMASLLDQSRKRVDEGKWTDQFGELVLWFAQQQEVERIFVNAAIKQKLCSQMGENPSLAKVRPWYFHDSHFHVRLKCPADSPQCRGQKPVLAKECGVADLAPWFTEESLKIQKAPPKTPIPRTASLPRSCMELR